MFNTLTQHRWPFNSAVQGDKRCRYAAERHRAKTLATSSVTSKVNPGRQYQAAATRVLTSGQSSFDSVKPGIPHGRTVGETALGPLWMGKVIGWLDLESFERQIELAYVPSRHHAENRRGCLLSRAAGRLYSRAERAAYRRSRLHRGADILPPHTIGATPEDTARGLPIFCR